MRVQVDAALFRSAAARLELIALVHLVQRGHTVEISPLDAPELADWLSQLGSLAAEYKALIELSLEESARFPAARRLRVVNQPLSRWSNDPLELTLPDALAFLQRPLRVLVENLRRDGAFLRAVGWRFREAFDRLLREFRLELSHGGGLEEMLKLVETHQDELWKQRTFVVFDSDALAPDHPSKPSEDLRRSCTAARIPHHRLFRRNAESYLPAPALEAWAKKRPAAQRDKQLRKVRVFDKLRADQRHHFNLKAGFDGDRERSDREIGFLLFADLQQPVYEILKTGFGREIANIFNETIPYFWLSNDDQDTEMAVLFKSLLEHA